MQETISKIHQKEGLILTFNKSPGQYPGSVTPISTPVKKLLSHADPFQMQNKLLTTEKENDY